MRAIDFPASNFTYTGGPSENFGTDQDVGDLPCYRGPVDVDGGGDATISCWRPSLVERLSILLFGRVWLHVRSPTFYPTSITGSRRYIEGPSE